MVRPVTRMPPTGLRRLFIDVTHCCTLLRTRYYYYIPRCPAIARPLRGTARPFVAMQDHVRAIQHS